MENPSANSEKTISKIRVNFVVRQLVYTCRTEIPRSWWSQLQVEFYPQFWRLFPATDYHKVDFKTLEKISTHLIRLCTPETLKYFGVPLVYHALVYLSPMEQEQVLQTLGEWYA